MIDSNDMVQLIQQLTALATALGLGALLPKIGRGILTLLTRGGVSRKRDETERLRSDNDRLRARLARLIDTNRVIRELAEGYRYQLIRAGITPVGEYPPINEDTDGP